MLQRFVCVSAVASLGGGGGVVLLAPSGPPPASGRLVAAAVGRCCSVSPSCDATVCCCWPVFLLLLSSSCEAERNASLTVKTWSKNYLTWIRISYGMEIPQPPLSLSLYPQPTLITTSPTIRAPSQMPTFILHLHSQSHRGWKKQT